MKCINKRKIITIILLISTTLQLVGCGKESKYIESIYNYESQYLSHVRSDTELITSDLIVGDSDLELKGYTMGTMSITNEDETTTLTDNYIAAALFDIDKQTQYYGDDIYEPLFPASTTKILTAYIALKYGNLDDVINVSNIVESIPSDSSVCGIKPGDKLTLRDLVTGLMVKSGNDNAMVIAEHISGDVDTFVALMNEEANKLGATQSNFVNPHGYHDEQHYTTAYDLYIIFNECIKNEDFVEIIKMNSYSTIITDANGVEQNVTWQATNRYKTGEAKLPSDVTIIGGKTGYTSKAKSCLVLMFLDEADNPFIAIILGAYDAPILYDEMTGLIESIPLIR